MTPAAALREAAAPAGGPGASQPAGAARRSPLALAALVLLLVAGAASLLRLGHSTGFFFDEWNFVFDRRAWTADALLLPHNGHLSVLPVLVYKLLFETVGLAPYWPYRVVAVAVQVLLSALVFAYARRRTGDLVALAAAAVIMWFGPAWDDKLWVFQIGFCGSLAAGLGALLALDRGTRRGDAVAGGLLLVSICCSSLGIPVLLAAVVEVALRADRRRRWPLLVPAVLPYALWFVTFRDKVPAGSESASLSNLDAVPGYLWRASTGAAGALAGLGTGEVGGLVILVALLALVAWGVGSGRVAGGPARARLAALIAAPLAFWVLAALARAGFAEPTAPRYLLPGALWLLLVGVEAAAGLRLPWPALAAGAVAVLAVGISNLGPLRDGAAALRDHTTVIRGALAATEAAAGQLPPGFQPAPADSPQIMVGPYLAAVRDLGSPAYSGAALPRTYEAARIAADTALIGGLPIAPVAGRAAADGNPPALEGVTAARAETAGGCLRAAPTGREGRVRVVLPPTGLFVDPSPGHTTVGLRRWNDTFLPLAAGVPQNGRAFALRAPPDALGGPWHVELDVVGPVRLCGAAA